MQHTALAVLLVAAVLADNVDTGQSDAANNDAGLSDAKNNEPGHGDAANHDSGYGDADNGYHQLVGIPMAKWIKAREDRFISNQPTTSRIWRGNKVFGMITEETYAFYGGLIINTVDRKGNHNQSSCGSALLTFKRLVTAAHCWDDGHVKATVMTVVLGSAFLYYGGTRMDTTEIYTHPQWNWVTIDNDIAIIYLPRKVTFNSLIIPVALPEGDDITREWDLYGAAVYGFGQTHIPWEDFYNTDGPSLRMVVVQIISNGKCSRQMWYPPSDRQMCSSGAEGKGPCYGDSGGPLITYTNRKFMVGITSFMGGLLCGQGKPNIYTRVGKYIDWIKSHAKIPKQEFAFTVLGGGYFQENVTITIEDVE